MAVAVVAVAVAAAVAALAFSFCLNADTKSDTFTSTFFKDENCSYKTRN